MVTINEPRYYNHIARNYSSCILMCHTIPVSLFVFTQLHPKATVSDARHRLLAQTEINVKWPFRITQTHVFWGQSKSDEGLHIAL